MAGFFKNKWLRRLAMWVLAPLVLIYGFIQLNYPTCTFRYKLTAEVMTPDGLKTGSSVIEVSYSHNGDWGGGKSANLKMLGEAVYVDLGGGKSVFVTLTADASGRVGNNSRNYEPFNGALDVFGIPLRAFGLKWELGEERSLQMQINALEVGRKYNLPLDNLPTIVALVGLNVPETFVVVQPDGSSPANGKKFKFVSVTVEKTNESVTQKIRTLIPDFDSQAEDWKRKLINFRW